MKSFLIIFTLISQLVLPIHAEIKMPSFFSDGMVLQQKSSARIWGWSEPGDIVHAEFKEQKSSATTDAHGKWNIEFTDLKASEEGHDLTVSSNGDKKIIKDVLVGEVWIASGQSNMEWNFERLNYRDIDREAKDDLLRVYITNNVTSSLPAKDFAGSWLSAEPENIGKITSVGYHFAKNLREKLNVPVGIIECAWGGKRIEPFISDASMRQASHLQYLVQAKDRAIKGYSLDAAQKRHTKALESWGKKIAEWEKTKQGRKPNKPKIIEDPRLRSNLHSTIYNGMIAPIAGYSAKGAIWYQGESNSNDGSANDYKELLKLLIKDWRNSWGSNLSFYYVQLANYGQTSRKGWVTVQDQKRQLLNDSEIGKSNIGMAVINDIGDLKDIHPSNKIDVGHRLARWALHKDYGMHDIIVSGPLYKSTEINNKNITVHFDYNDGLKTRDGKALGAFEMIDSKGQWHPAVAKIQDDKIIVSCEKVISPTKARYAWHITAKGANLINGEGLPASCFTTE